MAEPADGAGGNRDDGVGAQKSICGKQPLNPALPAWVLFIWANYQSGISAILNLKIPGYEYITARNSQLVCIQPHSYCTRWRYTSAPERDLPAIPTMRRCARLNVICHIHFDCKRHGRW